MVSAVLNRYAPDVENIIQDVISIASPFIHGVISYHFGWADQNFEPTDSERGKMLRPALCLLVFEALTGNYRKALPVAVALEMIHNFTLIHDDIEDGDLERRGRPTAWTIWGKPLAINVGDFLYTLAFHSLQQLDSNEFTPQTVLAVQELITHACLELTMGQDLDLRFEQTPVVSTDMYLDMVYKKTGALIEAAVVAGATLGTSDEAIVENYRTFAQNIGIAFQVRDDILGIWGDTAQTGKSADNDLRRKKKTLPVLYMLDKSTGQQREKLRHLYLTLEPLSDEQVAFVRQNLERVEAHAYAQATADTYIENGFAALSRIDISNQAQSELEAIARFLVDRSH